MVNMKNDSKNMEEKEERKLPDLAKKETKNKKEDIVRQWNTDT